MLALIGNLDLMEVLVIALAAIMIFGKDLPEVAVKAAAQVVRLRRAVTKMWREAGIEEEIRRVQREVERAKPSLPSVDSMVSDADRRRAERARELRELAPRPDLEHEDGLEREHGGTDEAWVRGEGDVDDGFRADSDSADGPDDPFAVRREPDGEVQDTPHLSARADRDPDPGSASESDPEATDDSEPIGHEPADHEPGPSAVADGKNEPDSKESA